jgi:PD-(D/E)XK endonuclease
VLRHADLVEHPKSIGDRSTLAIMLALRDAGYTVLLPFGENTRYDLVIDDGGSLGRVQCKTGRLRNGAVVFRTCSSYAHHRSPRNTSRHYLGEIDYFAVYCRETAGVYLIPLEHAPLTNAGSLRVAPPRNNQKRRIRMAVDYEIGQISMRAKKEPGATSGA